MSMKNLWQGSILGPLLFNVLINNTLFVVEKSEVYYFAGYNTLCSYGKYYFELNNNGFII